MKTISKSLGTITLLAGALFVSNTASAFDEEAAKALARQNNCFKCHAATKDKEGPAWNKTAAKYKGQADAVDRIVHHLTSGEKAKFPDGHEEDHKIIETSPPNDTAQIKNLAEWILSL